MSWGWYRKCEKCFPTKELLEELKGKDSIKKHAENLKDKGLKAVEPYFYLEIFSNRPEKYRRCSNCERWHVQNDPVYLKKSCNEFKPYEIPKCERCNSKEEILFIDKFSIVFIEKAFTRPENSPCFWPGGVFTPYFYVGKRYEQNENKDFEEEEIIISTVYFNGKNGKNYGGYGAYFSCEEDFIDKFVKWLQGLKK